MDPQNRVLITQVQPGSPAAQMGLEVGDEILGVDNQRVTNLDQVIGIIRQHTVGSPIAIHVVRGGRIQAAQANLGNFADFFPGRGTERQAARPISPPGNTQQR